MFTVTADAAPPADLTVSLTVADAPNADFVSSTNQGSGKSVTIQAGQTTADYTVSTTDGASETTDEPSGDVKVTVASGTGYTVSSSSSATVKVNDDDATTVTLTTPDTTAMEGSGSVLLKAAPSPSSLPKSPSPPTTGTFPSGCGSRRQRLQPGAAA